MQCIYSANYFDDRRGFRYYVRDLDLDSATALRDDIHHAGRELIQDKSYEQGTELLMIAAHCGDIEAQRAKQRYQTQRLGEQEPTGLPAVPSAEGRQKRHHQK